jgi:hypothetical protein
MQLKKQETMKKSASRNIRFIQIATSIVKSIHLKLYSSKYSKKIYTQHQLLAIILFRDFRNSITGNSLKMLETWNGSK